MPCDVGHHTAILPYFRVLPMIHIFFNAMWSSYCDTDLLSCTANDTDFPPCPVMLVIILQYCLQPYFCVLPIICDTDFPYLHHAKTVQHHLSWFPTSPSPLPPVSIFPTFLLS
ncbi:hypothetical protein BsWGS_09167 [Bradybaena similaris]